MVLPVSGVVGVNVSVASGSTWKPKATIMTGNLNAVIKALFAEGEQGLAFYPKNLSTLYQDVVGGIPVMSLTQPVAMMKDLSGQDNHAFQSTQRLRPIILDAGFLYPNDSPGFTINIPENLIDCTVIMSSQTSVFGVSTNQEVRAGKINITPEDFCLVINRQLTVYEIVAIKAAIGSFITRSLYWRLNSQKLMYSPDETTLMWQ